MNPHVTNELLLVLPLAWCVWMIARNVAESVRLCRWPFDVPEPPPPPLVDGFTEQERLAYRAGAELARHLQKRGEGTP